MYQRKICSDNNTTSPKKKRLIITLEHKSDVTERHEHDHSNYKIGRDTGMSEYMVKNITKHAGDIKEKRKSALAFCSLQGTG
jgi:hypothetical protein